MIKKSNIFVFFHHLHRLLQYKEKQQCSIIWFWRGFVCVVWYSNTKKCLMNVNLCEVFFFSCSDRMHDFFLFLQDMVFFQKSKSPAHHPSQNLNGPPLRAKNAVYNGRGAKLQLANSQACHFNWKKQIYQLNIIGLNTPTGGRQTSIWLFTSMTEQLN